MKKDNKARLFEVMERLDKTFKSKLNEDIKEPLQETSDDFLEITTPVNSVDEKLFISIINQGIDSNLDGFIKSKFNVRKGNLGDRRVFNFHKSELPILLKRLENIGTEEALQWKDDIENHDNTINEITQEFNND